MTLKISQKELEALDCEGRDHIWQYKTLYAISYSQVQACYYLEKILTYPFAGAGVTRRGRWVALTEQQAYNFLRGTQYQK